jgi:hypothetical protein
MDKARSRRRAGIIENILCGGREKPENRKKKSDAHANALGHSLKNNAFACFFSPGFD